MSFPAQWVATSSTHVVLDGVPFKITDNFRTPPVVASAESKLCLKSQSSFLQTQYLYDKEVASLRQYEDFISAREVAKERRKKEAAAAVTAAAAMAAAATSSVATSAEHGCRDSEPMLAAARPAAGAAEANGICIDGIGHPRSHAPAVAPRPATRPTHPGMGHDLLVPRPAVPAKPLLHGGPSSSTTTLGGMSSKAVPLDLALFEREEDVFDKMQLKTLNDFEELRSVLLQHEARPSVPYVALATESHSKGDGNSTCASAACRSESCGGIVAGGASDSASLAAAAGADVVASDIPLTASDSPRGTVGGSAPLPVLPMAVPATTAVSEVGPGQLALPAAAARADSKVAAMIGTGAPATTASSCPAVPAAALRPSPPEPATAKPRPVSHRKVLPSVPPKRHSSTTADGSMPDGPMHAAAPAASPGVSPMATSDATTTGALAGSVRLPPPPPPPKPTVHHADKPAKVASHKPPPLPPSVGPTGKPFSYVAGAALASPFSLRHPIAGLGSNASAVKNIVWPDLLSSPEATVSSAVISRSSTATPNQFSATGYANDGSGSSETVKVPTASRVPIIDPSGALARQELGANGGTSENDDGLTTKLVAMGFPCRHVEAAVKVFGTDDKKVIEHLCILSDLVDKGYDWRIAQKAILSYPGQLTKVQEYLLSYQRLLEYGFEGQKIQQALMAHDANAEKALDVLAGMASS